MLNIKDDYKISVLEKHGGIILVTQKTYLWPLKLCLAPWQEGFER